MRSLDSSGETPDEGAAMITRRTALKLSIGAGIAARIGFYHPRQQIWRGQGFGADLQVITVGSQRDTQAVFAKIKGEIARLEQIFSLFRTDSQISILNQEGRLANPAPELVRTLRIAQHIWQHSGGVFDPSVQALWHGHAPPRLIGFQHVLIEDHHISLQKSGMALTLNGLAQGFASDHISEWLKRHGLPQHLVNLGEYTAGAPANPYLRSPWKIGIENARRQLVDVAHLTQNAIATSQPDAMKTPGGQDHIINPKAESHRWGRVSVMAKHAVIADGWSTALSLMPRRRILALELNRLGIDAIWLSDHAGSTQRLM